MSLTLLTNLAGDVKPTFGSSSATGLSVRANGEEKIKVLDAAGNIIDAQMPAGTTAPLLSQKRNVTATTTNGSPNIVLTAGAITAADLGKDYSGTNIPTGAKILSFTDATHFVISLNATAAGSGLTHTVGDTNTGLVQSNYAAYAYVYAATTRYPFVENDIAINGSLAPRGNPSPSLSIQIDVNGSAINVTVPQSTRADIDQIWIFRTEFFTAQVDADLNAQAGNMFFIGAITNDPTKNGANTSFGDHNPTSTGDQVEVDNFGVPTFQFVIYQDPFWWGWGNFPFVSTASWTTAGVVTLTAAGKKWFDGRNGQFVRLSGVAVGGADGLGGFIFKWLTNTTAQLTSDGTTAVGLAAIGSGTVVIQGPATTLYRSKRRNPFSWGFTEYLGQSARVPQVYAFKIGGGVGTAIGMIPSVNFLLLCTEFPAGSFVLDLKLAGDPSFESSLKTLSTFYSISSHHSLFPAVKNFTAVRSLPEERVVLWGWDAKNYSILECDGFKINPISQRISSTLRNMSQNRAQQILAHGAYDARNRLNCLWLPTANTGMLVNFLIAQHHPTGEWFMLDEHDVLCSAQFQDAETNLNKIYVGTQSGLVGEAFAEGHFSDWQINPYNAGVVDTAGSTFVTRNDGGVFQNNQEGYIGAWCLLTDQNGNNEQWARISAVTPTRIDFDFIYSRVGGGTGAFNPLPQQGWLFYVGLIEVRALKYFDMGIPASDKKLSEIWLTLDGVDEATPLLASTFLRFYQEVSKNPADPLQDGKILLPIKRVNPLQGGAKSMIWYTRTPSTERLKIFGIEIIDRGYSQWRLFNYTLKAQP